MRIIWSRSGAESGHSPVRWIAVSTMGSSWGCEHWHVLSLPMRRGTRLWMRRLMVARACGGALIFSATTYSTTSA
ncbi:hypothetical protein GQ54DRAFT_115809 [Martensiomyces pterosporus]|nr:hypothetical protein GQ54DRAFT_115809 [Martensiomyces pterosporus]